MIRLFSLSLLCGCLSANVALADRTIALLSGDPNKVVTFPENGTIVILDGGWHAHAAVGVGMRLCTR